MRAARALSRSPLLAARPALSPPCRRASPAALTLFFRALSFRASSSAMPAVASDAVLGEAAPAAAAADAASPAPKRPRVEPSAAGAIPEAACAASNGAPTAEVGDGATPGADFDPCAGLPPLEGPMPAAAPLSPDLPLLSVAPMMDWTDVYYRQLARILSKKTWLYTEMVVDKTLVFNPCHDRFLWFPPEQKPIVCQLGGSEPQYFGQAAQYAAEYGYDELNINAGCPSDRVAGKGCFGASLMLRPETVAACCRAAAANAPGIPITVKCRIGVDDVDSYDALCRFVHVVSSRAPVTRFSIHARKCLLNGLSPHENRTIPPLRYAWAWALARDFPHLQFSINGGIQDIVHVARVLRGVVDEDQKDAADEEHEGAEKEAGDQALVSTTAAASPGVAPPPAAAASPDAARSPTAAGSPGAGAAPSPSANLASLRSVSLEGAMVGRAAYNDIWNVLASADTMIFGEPSNPPGAVSRRQAALEYAAFVDSMLATWSDERSATGWTPPSPHQLVKPLFGLFAGLPNGKLWRRAVDAALRSRKAPGAKRKRGKRLKEEAEERLEEKKEDAASAPGEGAATDAKADAPAPAPSVPAPSAPASSAAPAPSPELLPSGCKPLPSPRVFYSVKLPDTPPEGLMTSVMKETLPVMPKRVLDAPPGVGFDHDGNLIPGLFDDRHKGGAQHLPHFDADAVPETPAWLQRIRKAEGEKSDR